MLRGRVIAVVEIVDLELCRRGRGTPHLDCVPIDGATTACDGGHWCRVLLDGARALSHDTRADGMSLLHWRRCSGAAPMMALVPPTAQSDW